MSARGPKRLPFVQRLGPVDDDQYRRLGVESALAQVVQQLAHQGRVLGGPVPQAQHVFLAFGIDAQRHDQTLAREGLAIEEQRHQVRRHGPLAQRLKLRGGGFLPLA
jgi:hypothetical protein